MTNDVTRIVAQTAMPRVAGAAALVTAALVLAISAWALRALPLRRRGALLALRAIGVGAALVLFFQPALRSERLSTMPSRIAVLVDDSASMSLPEREGEKPRLERALQLANEAVGKLPLGDHVDRRVDLFTLPRTATRASGAEPELPIALPAGVPARAEGPLTRLGEALLGLPRGDGRDLAGVVLLSDGADHGRLGASELDDRTRDGLRALGAPVHTITIGEATVRDLVVGGVAHDDFAFVRTPISFEVELRALGAARAGWVGRSVPVQLRRDGMVIATQSVTITREPTQKVSFRHVPERVGEFIFDVSVLPLPGELTIGNNLARFSLRIVRDRVRILHVCGRPSWDERFLRSLFKRDPNVDLVSFFILRTPAYIEPASPDELALIPFPTQELFQESLDTFDLVVLQNFNYKPYEMEMYLPYLARYVEQGGALAMLGGELSFDGGLYAGTPIEALLPVELGVTAKVGTAPIDARAYRPKLTAPGRTHPLTALALDVDESARIFGALPALDGVNLVRRARPDATVLAVHPTLLDDDKQPLPVIAVRDAGRGRVLSVGSDSTWRWSFEGGAHGEGPRRPYERFWESAIRWLVRDPSLSLLRVEIDRTSSPPLARVSAVGPDYRPVAGAKVSFSLQRIEDPDGFPRNALHPPAPSDGTTTEAGKLERTLGTLPDGAYRLRALATLGGRPVEDEELFLVGNAGDELADPAARPALMAKLAALTGGKARESSDGISGLPFNAPREVRIAASDDRPIWTSPFWLLLCFGALTAAWALGRRWGRR